MPERTYFLTTAIDYTNAAPHIGHAYEKILADVIARHRRQCGKDVFFLTGVDQHGQKVQQAAEKAGETPGQFANRITQSFLDLWKQLGVSFDAWAATSDPLHHKVVQAVLQQLHDRGDLYKARHSGFYSVRQEQFLTDKERGPDGTFGEEWGEVVELEEENWYFRLSKYRAWLTEFLSKRGDFVLPAFRQNELINAVGRDTGDLCISRPKSRLSWGIAFPFDPDFVTYVWFDALINYVSFCGYQADQPTGGEEFRSRWPALHVIGKDILVPAHGVYWPCMLKAMGIEDAAMPTLLVHGWWNLRGAKVSKSLGNVVDPGLLASRYSVGALRYYLMRDIATGQDSDFQEDRLIGIYNTELANGLGNLLNRALNMSVRYREGILRPLPEQPCEATRELLQEIRDRVDLFQQRMESFQVHSALEAVSQMVSAANAYAEKQAPWKLAKDPEAGPLLEETLVTLAIAAACASLLLQPVLPEETGRALAQLRIAPDTAPDPATIFLGEHAVEKPEPVFPRIEAPV